MATNTRSKRRPNRLQVVTALLAVYTAYEEVAEGGIQANEIPGLVEEIVADLAPIYPQLGRNQKRVEAITTLIEAFADDEKGDS